MGGASKLYRTRTLIHGAIICTIAFAGRPVNACTPDEKRACEDQCGPRSDFPPGVYERCIGRCERQCKPVVQGTLTPKYYVLSVIYAPPGANGGGSSTSVSYERGSAAGTTLSANKSFKQGYSVSLGLGFVSNDGNKDKELGNVGGSWEYTRSTTDSNSLEIKKSATTMLTASGPSRDGIDHDEDIFYLWLNPSVDLAVVGDSVGWMLKDNGGVADIQRVYVGWLKNPSTMPPGVRQRLQAYQITEQEFPDILKQDPYASGSPPVDTARYQVLRTTLPYSPVLHQGDAVPPTVTFNLSNSASSSTSSSSQIDSNPGINGGINLAIIKIALKAELTWTWTNTNSQSAEDSESASVTVGGPAFGYTGPSDLLVYYDTIYRTFLFVPVEGALPAFRGIVADQTGRPVAMSPVSIVANGVTYRTLTDARGEYRIFGNIQGPFTLQAGGLTREVPSVPAERRLDIQLPQR